ncbi:MULTISPECIES: Na+/H+ antiporter subunit G [Sulfitobacter]|uniref:Na(+)/H(+) antiporter subunit G n=1 Tax=Sulfitobacter dubius TaxID=218673 RepID=A0ABY3ZKJ6_9RHOB|nr:Na+/H+ antiporter subunit G [Sulfitobacter dubius]UOA15201.1 Na(+)/H(+) antiporter subunit G [Sulfitobacter dubius]WOI29382.1 Na+/H+ antiporter subunit G [Sulfitobacter dubius]|tara:strand:+ start:779 stop:1174 length:396 start_codon:yes stop_codon:yes gene_type:complete
MSPDIIATYAVAVLLIIGSFFVVVAGIGLLKLNDPMTRLHAPTKAATLGIGAYLLAAMVSSFLSGSGSLHELLIMAFIFVTAPVSANFMAKANIHRRDCLPNPPELPDGDTWATLNVPEEDREIEETPPNA